MASCEHADLVDAAKRSLIEIRVDWGARELSNLIPPWGECCCSVIGEDKRYKLMKKVKITRISGKYPKIFSNLVDFETANEQ